MKVCPNSEGHVLFLLLHTVKGWSGVFVVGPATKECGMLYIIQFSH